MQKLAKNAYILIWSIFLSLIIGVTFITISDNVTKNLKQNIQIQESINLNKLVNSSLKDAVLKNDFSNINLGNNQILIFEKSNNINIGLKENEEISIKLYGDQNITIKINHGSPIQYENTASPYINGTISRIGTFQTGDGYLKITNLGGYSNIRISSEGFFNTKNKNYQIIQKIGNKNIVKENNYIKIF